MSAKRVRAHNRRRVTRQARRRRLRWLPSAVGLALALVLLSVRGGGDRVKTATASGERVAIRVHPPSWSYTDPVKAVIHLRPGRIDMGADFEGSGPILALGAGTVTMASNHDSGPPSCYGRTCWPVGGIVVYRLSNGPFAGKYVYVAERITPLVSTGQTVRAGQEIATMGDAYPYMETGWASGKGAETLAIADGHQCPWGDPGGWSTIEGRNFAGLLTLLGAPSEYVQPHVPDQRMPAGWPSWPVSDRSQSFTRSPTPLAEGAAPR